MSNLPVLVASSDLLPEGGPLNGRRSAGQTLLWLWSKYSASDPLVLLTAKELRNGFDQYAKLAGHSGILNILDFVDPSEIEPYEALFLPDPSIGRWAQWRAKTGSAKFSLVGQIHTLSTQASMALLQELVTEPTRSWDAVICSSHAGRAVVEAVMNDREEQLLKRFRNEPSVKIDRPYLPVIPLPIATKQIQEDLPKKDLARQRLGIDINSHVVLWLGRLSMLTKLDPWPTYIALQKASLSLDKPLILIECGPDDTSHQAKHFEDIRILCPNVKFMRFGGDNPVSETIKLSCLAAADIAISLVDNTQETFGLAVAEAMAAGLPVIASDWNGYRDLVRDGIDGFLIPTKWNSVAHECSKPIGWASSLGVMNYPMAAGCLAQLVQIDLPEAVAAIVSLLTQPVMMRAMGNAAKIRAEKEFSYEVVMNNYLELFEILKEKRRAAPKDCFQPETSSITLDPVQAFASYPSSLPDSIDLDHLKPIIIPEIVIEARRPMWNQLKSGVSSKLLSKLQYELLQKHQLKTTDSF